MPLAAQRSKDDPDDEIPTSSSSSHSSPTLTPRRWSHKKFGHSKRPAIQLAGPPTLCQQLQQRALPSTATLNTEGKTRQSPRRDEKKKRRRESDAKWRSNLSVCFKHLETKLLPGRNCTKTRLSKEMIVQKTVQKVQYLEAVFMFLKQADRHGNKSCFSPTRGHQSLQSARREFARKFYYKYRQKPSTETTSVEKTEPKAVQQEGVLPRFGKTNSEQLVPPLVKTTATGPAMEYPTECDPSRSNVPRERAVPSTPTKSLVCEERDLDTEDSWPETLNLTPKHIPNNAFNGHIQQTQVMTNPKRRALHDVARVPSQSPVRDQRSYVPTSPSLYSPDRPLVPSVPSHMKVGDRPASFDNHSVSPAAKNGIAGPSGLALKGSARSPARKYDEVTPHWPAYWSPAKSSAHRSPAISPGLASPCQVPRWSLPGTPVTNRSARCRSVPPFWPPSPASRSTDSQVKTSGHTFCSHPSYSPVHSPSVSHGTNDQIRPLYRSPARTLADNPTTSQAGTVLTYSALLPDLIMTSPSKRYKIVGKSVISLGDTGPETAQILTSPDQADDAPLPNLEPEGRVTPDLTCQEDIPSWKEDDRYQKRTPYGTPRSATHPPSIAPKRRPSAWSAKFVNDVRRATLGPGPKRAKSGRCKRLFCDDSGDSIAGQPIIKKEKLDQINAGSMVGDGKKAPRRKYHKRATAARVRPRNPLNSEVGSHVCGITRQRNCQHKSRAPICTPSPASSTEASPYRHPTAKLRSQSKASRRKSQTPRKVMRRGPRIVIEGAGMADVELDVEEIVDVEEVELDRPLEDVGQGSLLLSEIPQLPDDIITPLLLSNESSQCFLEDSDLEKTLQSEKYAIPPTINRLNTTKSDDEIVLTILELEKESRTSSSMHSSPDSIGNQHADPTPDTTSVNVADQAGLPDHLQGALLEAYRLMTGKSGTADSPPAVILSPIRLSGLSSLNEKLSPNKSSFYLISPVKQDSFSLEADDEEKMLLSSENDEDQITESMARFASRALSSQGLNTCNQKPAESDLEVSDVSSSQQVYQGAKQALLNGQIVGKTPAGPQSSCHQPQSTLICIDSGTPTKNQPQLPYSLPATVPLALQFGSQNPNSAYPTSDTEVHMGSSYTSTSPCLSPLSTSTLSTPGRYMSLTHVSQSSAETSLSSELPKEPYSWSQSSSPVIKQEPWDWTDPPDLQADESLDDMMGDEDLLAKYYQCLGGVDTARGNRSEQGQLEVPDWNAEKKVASQSPGDGITSSASPTSSSLLSFSLATGRISTGSPATDGLQSAEYQVVPSLSTNGNPAVRQDQMTGNKFDSRGRVGKKSAFDTFFWGVETGTREG
ncbi:uncharacterized protein LOC110975494 isoform X2 [Acanthaster planci]|uniref:Uncharacterized protein LOC110975494 isoform X2 n=1 Tax=Acanthaster planci TaxID=133434 RepID=A0A8B7XU12_ACAPL|nr:uncharacterized protein LOC110975494 isoform X2 [Acanthaster planci]